MNGKYMIDLNVRAMITIKKMKTRHRVEENVCETSSDKILLFRIYKELLQLSKTTQF